MELGSREGKAWLATASAGREGGREDRVRAARKRRAKEWREQLWNISEQE